MPANKVSLWVYFMGRFHIKVVFQKCVFVIFTNIENDYSLKIENNNDNNINYAWTTNQINTY